MKITTLEKISLMILLIIFGGIVIHAPISVGLGVLLPDYALLIKSWKELLLVLLIPLVCIIVTRRRMWRELAQDWIFRFVVLYGALHLVSAVLSYDGLGPTLAGLAIDLRYILFFGFVYVMVKVVPNSRQLFMRIGIIGAFIVVGFATTQLFLPADILTHIGYSKETITPYLTVDKNPDYIRVNSTLRGPNPLGAYAGMVLALLATAAIRMKVWRNDKKIIIGGIILAVCSFVAVWISYSRSALIGAAGSLIAVFSTTVMRKLSRRAWIISSAVLFALIGALVLGRDSSFVSNVLLHENQNGGSEVSSNDGHAQSLQDGFKLFVSQPFGAGVGSTGSASLEGANPIILENQYLFIAHEVGWLGLLLFIVIFIGVLVRLWHLRKDWLALGVFASGLGLASIGILLPVWADDTVSIVWWGLAAIALVGGKNDRKTTK